ncbi:hypothetical protein DEO72_LG3g1061 [Vigna unguiculata]|uniref:Uncharacterized protein n=1 Tax=Vigna unguiculata TaxID=3917 RepID=A0A4D6LDE3_VIGUN|nr:hypothetical protein DEO72_LG3g1061 [Vigna unguiculata]
MASLELWLGMADEHEELLVVARVGECCRSRHLEVFIRRRRTWVTWWLPYGV